MRDFKLDFVRVGEIEIRKSVHFQEARPSSEDMIAALNTMEFGDV